MKNSAWKEKAVSLGLAFVNGRKEQIRAGANWLDRFTSYNLEQVVGQPDSKTLMSWLLGELQRRHAIERTNEFAPGVPKNNHRPMRIWRIVL